MQFDLKLSAGSVISIILYDRHFIIFGQKVGRLVTLASRPTFKSGTAQAVPGRYVPTPLLSAIIAESSFLPRSFSRHLCSKGHIQLASLTLLYRRSTNCAEVANLNYFIENIQQLTKLQT